MKFCGGVGHDRLLLVLCSVMSALEIEGRKDKNKRDVPL